MGNSPGRDSELKIKILAGETQSQQLFDFHSPQKQQSVSELTFPSRLVFSNGEIIYTTSCESEENVQPLYSIQCTNVNHIVIRELFDRNDQNVEEYLWKVLVDGEEMQLQVGDSIKIGKTKITLKDIVKANLIQHRSTAINVSNQDQTQRDMSNFIDVPCKVVEGQCRVCFQNTETASNPLLSLCKCSGSVKYIHFECLKDWTSNSVKKDKSSNCLFYSYTQPNCCQLCKYPISNQVMHEGQKYKLYEFEKCEPPYAVFENRFYEEETGKTRVSIYTMLLPQNNRVSIGRNHTSQIILRDISVSRTHCLLTYRQGRLFIQDKKSKFGTLISPRKGFEFDSVHGLQLQYQSKIIQISKQMAFNNCCCPDNFSYYVELNKRFSN